MDTKNRRERQRRKKWDGNMLGNVPAGQMHIFRHLLPEKVRFISVFLVLYFANFFFNVQILLYNPGISCVAFE